MTLRGIAPGSSISVPVTVPNGGTGLTSGTSGGVLYFNSTTTMASSALLAAGGVVFGGGAGAAPETDAGLTYDPSTDALTVAGSVNLPGPGATFPLVFNPGSNATKIRQRFNQTFGITFNTTNALYLVTTGLQLGSGVSVGWAATSDAEGSTDTAQGRAAANSIVYSASGVAGNATSRTEINKAVTAFTDGVAKATFTVTIPNASHNATLEVEVTGICGAGGAIGAGECSATNSYKFNISRTAGVNAVVGVSAAFGAAASNVAGGTTITATAVASAISGAVGATNTFTVNVTITKGGGASDNHVALMYGKLMNANASGITIA